MSRLIRVSDETVNDLCYQKRAVAWPAQQRVVSDASAAPDEATLPTIDWCVTHEAHVHSNGRQWWHPRGFDSAKPCRVVRIPLPVHLGVEVTP